MLEDPLSEQLRSQYDEMVTQRDHELDVKNKAAGLTGRLNNWQKLPDMFRTQTLAEISGLVIKAQEGDELSQQILDRTEGTLVEGKVDTTKLPNLSWKPEPPTGS